MQLSSLCHLAILAALSATLPTSASARGPALSNFLVGPPLEGQLNVNTATVEQWDLLPGIGRVTAERIVAYVQRHPLRQTGHLQRVKGIGRKTYNKLREFLTLEGETTLRLSGTNDGQPPNPRDQDGISGTPNKARSQNHSGGAPQ